MAVDDHGLEAIRKAAEQVTPGDKSDYYIKVKVDGDSITIDNATISVDLDASEDSVEVLQDTHDDLNANANIQIGDADVSGANPVPISAATLPLPTGASTSANQTSLITNTNNLVKLPDSGTSGKSSIGSVSEVEITASAGQQAVTITNISAGKVHYALSTGVDTTFDSLSKGDQLILNNYAGSVFLIRASGTADVQVDKRIRT